MGDQVKVPFGDDPSETATLLLAAADELDDFEQHQVLTVEGAFLVPQEIAEQAGLTPDEPSEPEPEPAPEEQTEE